MSRAHIILHHIQRLTEYATMIVGLERGHSNKNEYTISSVRGNNADRMGANDHSSRSPHHYTRPSGRIAAAVPLILRVNVSRCDSEDFNQLTAMQRSLSTPFHSCMVLRPRRELSSPRCPNEKFSQP